MFPKKIIYTMVISAIVIGFFSFINATSDGALINPSTFEDISDYFQNMAQKDGAERAFAALAKAKLPSNIDLHLLGHVVGDELYKQKGIDGVSVCTDNFRNACSHSIVIGTLLEKGEGALPNIADTCRKAPGGSGAYTMCFHGLGHGVLAYTDYELKDAVPLCRKTGTEEYSNREYIECVGGTIMEMIGGVHDKETRIIKSQKYLPANDPLYPCSADFMPKEVQPICYIYLTPHLFEAVGGNLGNPTPKDFEAAFKLCDIIPLNERINREACFGGFGKEFTVLANDRDVRSIEQMNSEQLQTVYEWCALAKVEDGILSCIDSAVKSLYWGGENDPDVALRFCSEINNIEHQGSCTNNLIHEVDFYIHDIRYKKRFCNIVPEKYQDSCEVILK